MHHTSTVDLPVLKDLSSTAAANNPEKVAFGNELDGRTVTWRTFDDESVRAANAFAARLGQGDKVAFFCQNSIEHTVLWNGALKAGCVVSNLHSRESVESVQYCIDSFSPRALVVDETTAEFFDERVRDGLDTNVDVLVTTGEPRTDHEQGFDSFIAERSTTAPDVRVRENDLAAVLWTSGTTGTPKGWCHTNRSLYLRGINNVDVLGLDRSARQPNTFSPAFAAWYSVMLPALASGASTFFLSRWDPEDYLRMVERHGITVTNMVPTMYREILDVDGFEAYDTSSLKTVVSAGEVLDPTTLNRLRENLCEVVKNSYAATEVYATVMANDELNEERAKSVGKPVPGARIRVIDRNGSYRDTKPTGEVGELAIKAPDCPVWAWGRTDRTEDLFEDGWWYSGDLGHRDEDGYLYIEGRTDFMILSKGIKVYPAPVEERLNAHPGVSESAVVGVEDDEYGQKVTAYVHRSDPDVTADDLDEWCLESDKLARLERPRTYHFVDEPLPRTSTGKLDRRSTKGLERSQ